MLCTPPFGLSKSKNVLEHHNFNVFNILRYGHLRYKYETVRKWQQVSAQLVRFINSLTPNFFLTEFSGSGTELGNARSTGGGVW